MEGAVGKFDWELKIFFFLLAVMQFFICLGYELRALGVFFPFCHLRYHYVQCIVSFCEGGNCLHLAWSFYVSFYFSFFISLKGLDV